jgi:GntR family transcriptional regulator, transcriptional repressor for pyruvate dehydrogenase complex
VAAETSDVIGLIPPLLTGARADEVEQRIRQAITLGLLPDGQQLPAESTFATQLGVSPMTLRDALGSLREQGLVETRRGRSGGTFVRRPTDPLVPFLVSRLRALSATALRDLADEHAAISGMSARLAADRASEANVRRLRSFVDQLGTATSLGPRIRADSRFHVELAVASQSERLMQRELALQGQVGDLLWTPHEPDHDVARAVRDHAAITAAVAAEDGPRARDLAEQHVYRNLRRLTEMHQALTKAKRSK